MNALLTSLLGLSAYKPVTLLLYYQWLRKQTTIYIRTTRRLQVGTGEDSYITKPDRLTGLSETEHAKDGLGT
jgi:hypothetical protein